MGRAWHYVRAATSPLCYAPNPFVLVAANTPTVKRGYCVTEQDFVLNHCAGFVSLKTGEKRENNKETKTENEAI